MRRSRQTKAEVSDATAAAMLEASSMELIVRSIVDGDDVAPHLTAVLSEGTGENFLAVLDNAITEKREEIDGICDQHFQDFIRTVDDLLVVRKEAGALKKLIVDMNTNVQKLGRTVLIKTDDFNEQQAILRDIQATQAMLRRVSVVIQEISKIEDQIVAKKYLPALKAALFLRNDVLSNLVLPSITPHLENKTNELCELVRARAIESFKQWLTKAREQALHVGTEARAFYRKSVQPEQSATSNSKSQPNQIPRPRTSAGPEVNSRSVQVVHLDFSPVYQCYHIHQDLDQSAAFRRYYLTDRKTQMRLDFSELAWNGSESLVQPVSDLFARAIGYFVIESTIFKATANLLSADDLRGLWELATVQLKSTILVKAVQITNEKELREIKTQVELFCSTLEMYEYDTGVFDRLHATLREQWSRIIEGEDVERLQKLYLEGIYTPFVVTTKPDMELVTQFKLLPPETKPLALPFTCTFSPMVMTACRIITEAIRASLNLIEHEATASNVLVMTDTLLTKGLDQTFQQMLTHNDQLSLSQAFQLWLDASALVRFSTMLQDHLTQQIQIYLHTDEPRKLTAPRLLEQTETEVRSAVFNIIRTKTTQMLGLEDCTWFLTYPPTSPTQGIVDTLMFGENAFGGFLQLPTDEISRIFTYFVSEIASLLKRSMLECESINTHGLHRLNLDISELEQFVETHNIERPSALKELRQVLDLTLGGNIEGFFTEGVRSVLYPDINRDDLRALIEKYAKSKDENPSRKAANAFLKSEKEKRSWSRQKK